VSITYEFESKPAAGETMQVADGLHWLRMPLPMELANINLWLLEKEDGWSIVDTGINTEVSRNIWRKALLDVTAGKPVDQIIVTHLHPDHVGCAGWLAQEYGIGLWMTRSEYLLCRILTADTGRPAPEAGVGFYRAAGFPDESLDRYRQMFGMFGKYVAAMPESYNRIKDGDELTSSAHCWEVIVGHGHSLEHACLLDADRNLFISGDQVLPTISSNVSVYPTEPGANPLRDWLESLADLKRRLPEDVLVLPAHGKPFRGVHSRLDELTQEHLTALDKLHDLCREPVRAVDVFPALFKGRISQSNLILATGESVAHLNYLLAEGQLTASADADGVVWYQRS
jgi:glyoxylase-like metal-dependent hydrolase (beta-lactamase superfamily II)